MDRDLDVHERLQHDLDGALDDLGAELSDTFPAYRKRIRTTVEALPEWAETTPDEVRALFELPDDELDTEDAWLGPQAAGVAAGEVEAFLFEWFGDPENETPSTAFDDEAERNRFDRESRQLQTWLARFEEIAYRRIEEAHETLDGYFQKTLTALQEEREERFEVLRERVNQGDIEPGEDAEAERGRLWEQQRRRAEAVRASWREIRELLDEGYTYAAARLEELAELVDDAHAEMEVRYDEVSDCSILETLERRVATRTAEQTADHERPEENLTEDVAPEMPGSSQLDRTAPAGREVDAPDEAGETLDAALGDVASETTDETSATQPSFGALDDIEDDDVDGGFSRDPLASDGDELGRDPLAGDIPTPDESPAESSVDEVAPAESDPELAATAEADTEAEPDRDTSGLISFDDVTDDVTDAVDEPDRPEADAPEAETPAAPSETRPASRGGTRDTAPGRDADSETQPMVDPESSPSQGDSASELPDVGDTSSEALPDTHAELGGPDSPVSDSEVEDTFDLTSSSSATDASHPESSPPSARSEARAPADTGTSPGETPSTDPARRPELERAEVPAEEETEAPVEAHTDPGDDRLAADTGSNAPAVESTCLRIRDVWEPIEWPSLALALGPPLAVLTLLVGLSLLHLLGIPGVVNPVRAWSWTKPVAAVSVIWCVCAPMIMRWRPRWRGWSFDLLREVENRKEREMSVDERGFEFGDQTYAWEDVRQVKRGRWADRDDEIYGWRVVVELKTGDELDFVAREFDVQTWRGSSTPIVEPARDAWQVDTDLIEAVVERAPSGDTIETDLGGE